jgi:hypothetical protein
MRTTMRLAAIGILGWSTTAIAQEAAAPPPAASAPGAAADVQADVDVTTEVAPTPDGEVTAQSDEAPAPGELQPAPEGEFEAAPVLEERRTVRQERSANARADNRWRYKFHQGTWWYWLPSNRWTFWTGDEWRPYSAGAFRDWQAANMPRPTDSYGSRYVDQLPYSYTDGYEYPNSPQFRGYPYGYNNSPYGYESYPYGYNNTYGYGNSPYGYNSGYRGGAYGNMYQQGQGGYGYGGYGNGGYGAGRYQGDVGGRVGSSLGGAIGERIGGSAGGQIGAQIGGAIGSDR